MAIKAISTAALPLRQWPAPGAWTYEDYLDLPNDGYHYEIIDGELYMIPPPPIKHQLISGELGFALQTFVKAHHLGIVINAPCDVLLRPGGTPVEPDILFIAQARLHIFTPKNVQGVPDLIVEVLSWAHPEHDRYRKFRLYEQSGVPEYWIVDPDARTIELFVLTEGRYALRGRFSPGEKAISTVLPDFSVAVADVIPEGL